MSNALLRYGGKLPHLLAMMTGRGREVIVTPPTWTVRISRWLVGLIACVLLYQAYALIVVPWVEPPLSNSDSRGPRDISEPHPVPKIAGIEKLFPEDAWERNGPLELKTQWGWLLFKEYKPTQQGVELCPCTILIQAPSNSEDGDGEKRTFVMKTQDKAVVSISGGTNLMRAQVGKLKGANLEGEVHIYAEETKEGANDALNIVTRNIQILPKKIWTPHDVAFQYGSSRGSGRLLTITLTSQDSAESEEAEQALVKNIEMLELVHVDRLHLDFPGKGLLGDVFDKSEAANRRQGDLASNSKPQSNAVDVTCKGPFRFNFQTGIATLEDYVNVVRVNEGIEDDVLHCTRMLIHFRSAREDEQMPPADVDRHHGNSKRMVPKLAIRKIEALGNDVVLQAPSVQVAARGELLQYDFETRRILLQDPKDNALLVYRQHITESPRLEYELPEDPKRLGKLWAAGPGVYRGTLGQQEKRQPLSVRWNGILELQPQDNLHVLSVTKGADAHSESLGKFSADKLFVWLTEVPSAAESGEPLGALPPPPALNDPSGTISTPAQQDVEFEVRPVKMLAQGNVRADCEQFKGETNHLEIWFDQPEVEQENDPSGGAAPASGSASPSLSTPDMGSDPESKKEVKRLELTGNQIRLRLRMVKPKPVVREATVLGQVRFAQLAAVPGDPIPLLVTGNMLQLRTDHLERSAIDVRGDAEHPARVQAQGMLLEGSNLHVSQRENLMWSEGPGRTRLPARATKNQPRADEATKPAATAPIWITWQGGMDFDGQLIRFMKQVEVSGIHTSGDGKQYYLRSVGDQLHATLNRYVEFGKTKNTDDLDVSELRFLGDVYTENQTFNPQNELTSHDRMRGRDLTLDQTTGEFQAMGPGWLTTTQIDDGSLSEHLGGGPSSGARRTEVGNAATKLIYMRIDFQNAIQGNLKQREGEFVHFVRTVYGPVRTWDQTLDPNRQGGLGPDGLVMTCNQLKVADMGDRKNRALELSAVGNTIVEGSQFLATADRLTYVQAKDQLVLEGIGHNFATLQRRVQIGSEADKLEARKIIYNVKTNQADFTDIKQMNINQIGSPMKLPDPRLR